MESEARGFLREVLTFFESTRKTSWGKNEVREQLKDLYIEFLEKQNNSPKAILYDPGSREAIKL